jgi:acetylornithine deacetylase
VDGWLTRHGAGDMKGGFAMCLLCVAALRQAAPDALAGDDPAFDHLPRPCNVNVGTVAVGDWPSSVPARARLGVRVGFPRRWTPAEAFGRVRAAVLGVAADDPWLAARPPSVRPAGFRAQGYLIDKEYPLVGALAAARQRVHGEPPRRVVMGSIISGARALARFIAGFFAAGAFEGGVQA